jgi:hypothetical protein
VRGAENPILLEQVFNHRLLLSVDPAREQENEKGERRRQRVHGSSLPEWLAQCKARHIRERAPSAWADRCAGSLLRLRRIRRVSSDLASAEFRTR